MKKVTLDVIAEKFGVSKNTVSKALRGLPGVGPELRESIVKYVEEYGYEKNGRYKPEHKEGVNITLISRKAFFEESTYWSQVFYGVLNYTSKKNIQIRTVAFEENFDEAASTISSAAIDKCDGYLVAGAIDNSLLLKVREMEVPLVVIDHYSDLVDCDYINADNAKGIYKAMTYLYQNNHRRIGFINNIDRAYSYTCRCDAYIKNMKLLGLTPDERYIWHDAPYNDYGYYFDKINAYRNMDDFPTAWVCVNDSTAAIYTAALNKLGISTPDDVSVIGFDNINSVNAAGLTTINVPQKVMGQRAVRQLLRRINNPGEPFENILLGTQLIVRESVKNITL